MNKLTQIEGIHEKFAALLQAAGIKNIPQLLEACGHRNGRLTVAEQTGISYKLILKWTNQADLARIHGIEEEYAELLERSGVDSVPELAQRNPENLYLTMKEINDKKQLVRRLPSLTQIESWINEAKTLPRAVYH